MKVTSGLWWGLVLAAVLTPAPTHGQGMAGQGINMPDARQMSGTPLNVADLPAGTVTVRVVRGAMTNPLPGQKVEISGAASVSGTTNEAGRAEFPNLPVGGRIKASVTVDGERIESQEFAIPAAGGIRVALVAVDPEMAKRESEDRTLAAGPARTGIVVFGDQSRIVFEIGDDGLNAFNIFEIENTARTPVNPAVPVVFDLPDGAKGAAILDGSSPLAKVQGPQVRVEGPFPPGKTLVQFAYTLPYAGSDVTIAQKLPAALAQVSVIVQKIGDMRVTSDQLRQQQEMRAEGGTFLVGQGPPLAAGSELKVQITGLPSHPLWPRNVALALAVAILLGGAVGAIRGRSARGVAADRQRLEAERERLFAQLTALEVAHRSGEVDATAYDARRRTLVTSLEQLYAALDEDAAA